MEGVRLRSAHAGRRRTSTCCRGEFKEGVRLRSAHAGRRRACSGEFTMIRGSVSTKKILRVDEDRPPRRGGPAHDQPRQTSAFFLYVSRPSSPTKIVLLTPLDLPLLWPLYDPPARKLLPPHENFYRSMIHPHENGFFSTRTKTFTTTETKPRLPPGILEVLSGRGPERPSHSPSSGSSLHSPSTDPRRTE